MHDIRGPRQRPEVIRGGKSISEQKEQQEQPTMIDFWAPISKSRFLRDRALQTGPPSPDKAIRSIATLTPRAKGNGRDTQRQRGCQSEQGSMHVRADNSNFDQPLRLYFPRICGVCV